MTDPNESRLERLFEGVWNGADPSVATDLVHPRYHIHDRSLADDLQGPDLYRALAAGTREVFPDMAVTIEGTVADSETVAVRWTMHGTHEGSFMGVEATGREVRVPAIEFDRFEDGLLVETWTQSDQLGLLEQLGAWPPGEE
jgi:steroid delta-isomerase-like uncharacterized protein